MLFIFCNYISQILSLPPSVSFHILVSECLTYITKYFLYYEICLFCSFVNEGPGFAFIRKHIMYVVTYNIHQHLEALYIYICTFIYVAEFIVPPLSHCPSVQLYFSFRFLSSYSDFFITLLLVCSVLFLSLHSSIY